MSALTNPFLIMDQALQQYNIAQHLLKVTFPLIKDPKLLIGINQNIFSSMNLVTDSILLSERQLGVIPVYSKTFPGKFNTFQLKSVKRNKIPIKITKLVQELYELLEEHKKSPIEFKRGKQYIICDNKYKMNILSPKIIKRNLELANEFISLGEKIINNNNKIKKKQ